MSTPGEQAVREAMTESIRMTNESDMEQHRDWVDPTESPIVINARLIKAVELRVLALESRHEKLEAKVDANTTLMKSIKNDTAGLVEIAVAAKGFLQVTRWLGTFVKWCSIIGAPIGAVILAVRGWK